MSLIVQGEELFPVMVDDGDTEIVLVVLEVLITIRVISYPELTENVIDELAAHSHRFFDDPLFHVALVALHDIFPADPLD